MTRHTPVAISIFKMPSARNGRTGNGSAAIVALERRFIASPAGSGEAMVAVSTGELEVADCPLGRAAG